jgi:hypothetical protein
MNIELGGRLNPRQAGCLAIYVKEMRIWDAAFAHKSNRSFQQFVAFIAVPFAVSGVMRRAYLAAATIVLAFFAFGRTR